MDGCAYCGKDDDKLLYSEETDAYLHLDCLKGEIEKRPRDPEMLALGREFRKLLAQPSDGEEVEPLKKDEPLKKAVGTG